MTGPRPLRVWVTRDEDPDGPLSAALLACGFAPVLEPVVARRAVSDARAEISALGPEDWLVLTSPYAAGIVAAGLAGCRVAVVGQTTAAAARERGLRPDLVGPDSTGTGLWRALAAQIRSGRICYARSSLATPPPAWDGVEIVAPIVYETTMVAFDSGVADRTDIVTVASASAAAALAGLSGVAGLPPCASIGPVTSAALRAVGVEVWAEAPEPSFTSLAQAIAAASHPMRPGPDEPRA